VAALALAAFLATGLPALADTGAVTLVVPWGQWVTKALTSAESVAVAIVAAVVAKWAPAYVKSLLTEQVIGNAVDYAFGAVAGAVKGKELDVATTNALIDAAVHYAVVNEPKIAAWLGGALRSAVLAKLSALGVAPVAATAAQVGASLPPK
jgi:hypothetical protein